MSNNDEIDHTMPKTFHENDNTPVDRSTGDSNAKTSNIDTTSIEHSEDKVNDVASNSKAKGWVQFEDEDNKRPKGENIPQMETVDLTEKVIKFLHFLCHLSLHNGTIRSYITSLGDIFLFKYSKF